MDARMNFCERGKVYLLQYYLSLPFFSPCPLLPPFHSLLSPLLPSSNMLFLPSREMTPLDSAICGLESAASSSTGVQGRAPAANAFRARSILSR